MPANDASEEEMIPLDAVHQFAYCPRRAYLMHHDGRWDDNEYTAEGRLVHRRVDENEDVLVEPSISDDEPPRVSRSVSLGSITLGITAKLDLVETDKNEAVPVETKRGKVPDNPERSWEPERVQLIVQGLLLRESGYHCNRGILYFSGSRTRVDVMFDETLEKRAMELIKATIEILAGTSIPQPLVDSPKCRGCSLAGICLPDETHVLQILGDTASMVDPGAPGEVRRFYPARDDSLPFYVQEQGACIGKDGDGFKVTKGRVELGSVRLVDISQLVICGNISISAQALHLCAEAGVPVVHLSMGNWFYGITQGFVLKNAFDRAAQFAVAADPARCLALAKCFMNAKCQNQRTLLRRNTRDSEDRVLDEMAKLIASIETAPNLGTLLGIEGGLAAKYFSNFGRMIKTREGLEAFDWGSRNRRPPRDPLNSMLSFGYALLAKECTVALASVGLDPFWGFYHQPRHGRPSLALDLMEEFRPLIVDSAVLSAVNTGMVAIHDFETGSNGCLMTSSCRRSFIKAYESRLDQMFTHPVFDYRCSWRRVIFMQAQLLGRFLRGELRTYQGVTTR